MDNCLKDFDEIISPEDPDSKSSDLLSKSLIRLGFLLFYHEQALSVPLALLEKTAAIVCCKT